MPTRNRTTRMTLEQARAAAATIPPVPMVSDAEIERRAASDPDAPLATDEQLAEFVREYPDGATRLRPKQLLSLRIDADVIDAYRATGPGWQRRMHEAIVAGTPGRAAPTVALPRVQSPDATLGSLEERVSALEAVIARPTARLYKPGSAPGVRTTTGRSVSEGKAPRTSVAVGKARDRASGKQKPSR